jgi:hypothetical protein
MTDLNWELTGNPPASIHADVLELVAATAAEFIPALDDVGSQ